MALYDLGPGAQFHYTNTQPETPYTFGQQLPKAPPSSPTPTPTNGFVNPVPPSSLTQTPTNGFVNPVPPSSPTQTPNSATPTVGTSWLASRYPTIVQAYQTALGRAPSDAEILSQTGNGTFDPFDPRLSLSAVNIWKSPEAQAYAKTRQTPTNQTSTTTSVPGGDYQAWFRSLTNGKPPTPQMLISLEPELSKYGIKVLRNASGVAGKIQLPNGQIVDVIQAAGTGGTAWQWLTGDGGTGGAAAGGGIFTDPATAQWERALQQLVGRMNQPYEAPGMAPLVQYLQQYAKQLQGPAYTPQQMDVLQTQALDPLSAQRDAMRQQILQRAAARGLNPDSGIVQDEINQLDRSLAQTRSQRQGQFASNAVNLDRQNHQLAAQILAQIPALQTQQFGGNEQRQLQALSLLSQLPQMADRRLQLALQTMAPQNVNPMQAFAQQQGYQRQGLYQNQMDQNFWNQIGQSVWKLIFGG